MKLYGTRSLWQVTDHLQDHCPALSLLLSGTVSHLWAAHIALYQIALRARVRCEASG